VISSDQRAEMSRASAVAKAQRIRSSVAAETASLAKQAERRGPGHQEKAAYVEAPKQKGAGAGRHSV